VNPARKLATYADLLALSDDARGEIIVAHYWIADPFERTLEALQLDASTKLSPAE
jgi:hypothetical protein